MASKKYAYYNKGNKIGIVEKSYSGSSGNLAVAHCSIAGHSNKTDCEAAGGQWIPGSAGGLDNYGKYLSPTEDVANGLEIEYTYIPSYHNAEKDQLQYNKFYVNGWGVIDGYLSFFRCHKTATTNWDSAPYNEVGNDEYILVEGSGRWNGIHKVQSAGATGFLKTYTKVNQSWRAVVGASNIDTHEESGGKALIEANDGSNIWLNAEFSAGDYIWIHGSGGAKNNGFWEIDSVATDAGTESASGIYVGKRYYCHDGENTLSTEGIDSADTDAASNDSLNVYKAERDFCTIKTNITLMEDESFDVDVNHQQAQAIIYYIRARMMEEMGELERREFYLREFRRTLEKSSTDKRKGYYRIQGQGMTR